MLVQAQAPGVRKSKSSNPRHTLASHDDDDDDDDGEDEEEVAITFTESPAYIKGGTMRPYQVQGLNWLANLYEHGINGILADEMGLGKTLQTLSLLGYLQAYRKIRGPHLLIVPKSTLQNWLNEARRWVPDLNAFILHGDKEERSHLIKSVLIPREFDLCIASYETVMIEKSAMCKVNWIYLVIDEAHRIKNEKSMLAQLVRDLKTLRRLLITGTPLQNNLHELWALLNFLLPDIFSSSEHFDAWFEQHQEHSQEVVVEQLRRLLSPFLLRRLKADVEHSLLPKKEVNLYVGLSPLQREWYKRLLERDLDAVNGLMVKQREGKLRLQNLVMQLRKCANHPYLFEGAEPGPPFTTDEHLVEASGKLVVLDKLLARLRENGSRVLLFSQMSRVLDILEDYCGLRGYAYCRIDGQTAHEERIQAIEEYNRPESEKFIFLLTTRAGGLGINLATADIVILYDSDWNPQVDLQAQDRAHRIGQTKQVCVFRLISEDTVEEKVLERALQKLRLDQLVIQQGKLTNANKPLTQDEMLAMVRHGAEKLFLPGHPTSSPFDAEIEEILRRGEERTKELAAKYQNAGLEDLQKFSLDATISTGGPMATTSDPLGTSWLFIAPQKRERKVNYAIDGYYREALRVNPVKPRPTKAPMPKGLPNLQDFQFPSDRLRQLIDREIWSYQRAQGWRVPEAEDADAKAEQHLIDTAEPLDDQEMAEKDRLLAQTFTNWTRKDYYQLLRALEKHGRKASPTTLATELDGSNNGVEEVQAYMKVFWRRYRELPDAEKIDAMLEKTDARLARISQIQSALDVKMRRGDPIIINYYGGKGRHFSDHEDAFLLRALHRHGYAGDDGEVWERIRREVLVAPQFRFDWFIKTRSAGDIGKRCMKLVGYIEREAREENLVNNKPPPSHQRRR